MRKLSVSKSGGPKIEYQFRMDARHGNMSFGMALSYGPYKTAMAALKSARSFLRDQGGMRWPYSVQQRESGGSWVTIWRETFRTQGVKR